jgi:hypothetical protein
MFITLVLKTTFFRRKLEKIVKNSDHYIEPFKLVRGLSSSPVNIRVQCSPLGVNSCFVKTPFIVGRHIHAYADEGTFMRHMYIMTNCTIHAAQVRQTKLEYHIAKLLRIRVCRSCDTLCRTCICKFYHSLMTHTYVCRHILYWSYL